MAAVRMRSVQVTSLLIHVHTDHYVCTAVATGDKTTTQEHIAVST